MQKWLLIVSLLSLSFIKGLSVFEFYKSIEKFDDSIVLDVRLWDDYALGRIGNSVWAGELSELEKIVKDLDKRTSIFIYCDQNFRSNIVLKELKKRGFKRLYQLNGGFNRWKSEDFPIDTSKVCAPN